jgi:two-component system chemotaxis sensor kinase CheA
MDPMAAIKQTFFQECDEQLSELESGLLSIEGGDHDPETINAVFRAVHSIKGGAGAFGFEELVEFVHVYETTLDHLRSNKLAATPATTNIFLKAADALSDLVRAVREDIRADAEGVASIKAELDLLCNIASSSEGNADEGGVDELHFQPILIALDSIFETNADDAAPSRNIFEIKFRPRPSMYAKANETARLLRQLAELGTMRVECGADDVPFLSELDPEGAYLCWTIRLETDVAASRIEEIFEFVAWDCELEISRLDLEEWPRAPHEAFEKGSDTTPLAGQSIRGAAHDEGLPSASKASPSAGANVARGESGKTEQAPSSQQATIRVDLDKVDRLVNLVGELVINQAVLSQRVTEAGLSRASSVMIGLDEFEQLTRDIQDSVMAIRAQPVKPIFQRMSRVVREVAAITKKSVRLVTEGENTEVDKTVIERLTDPLTHMIRNAVDHGIESAETRVAAGKPEEGVLRLSAMHRSGRIVIELSDDGAGINRARVRQLAAAKGLIAEDADLTDDDIDNLIFAPGFSTVENASAVSGRGVGMDVVKRAIQALGGRITISSRPGHGSTFSMSLPLTLAVMDGMVVTVAKQTFIVPLTVIVETLQPKRENVHALGRGTRLIKSRDSLIPLIDLGAALQYRNEDEDPTAQVALLTESESGGRCALLVDAIQGQRQVVIKSLEANYGHVRGIAAATILGDGRVALIVDVDAIVNGLKMDVSISDSALCPAE